MSVVGATASRLFVASDTAVAAGIASAVVDTVVVAASADVVVVVVGTVAVVGIASKRLLSLPS